MNWEIVLLGLLSIVLLVQCQHLTKDNLTDGTEVLRCLPRSEQAPFLAYTLGQGYMEQYRSDYKKWPFPKLLKIPKILEKKFQHLEKPKNFTNNMYSFVQTSFNLGNKEMFLLILRRRLCFPSKRWCIDLENIGGLCCPF